MLGEWSRPAGSTQAIHFALTEWVMGKKKPLSPNAGLCYIPHTTERDVLNMNDIHYLKKKLGRLTTFSYLSI